MARGPRRGASLLCGGRRCYSVRVRALDCPARLRTLAAALLVAAPLAVASSGCASACKRVAADRQAFLQREASASAPQLLLALPLAPLSQELTRRLSRVKPVRVPLPELGIGGVDLPLGSLSARLHSIILLPAAPEHLAFRARVNLSAGNQTVTTIDLEAEFRPRLDVANGVVDVAVTPADIARVRPTIPASERKRLGDFLYGQVPAMARRFVNRQAVDGLVERLADDLLGGSWPLIRDNLLGDVGTLTEFSIDLPELPLAAIGLRSTDADLLLAITSDLPAAGLTSLARDPNTPATLPQLRISGSAVAELVHWQMAEGAIPGRYTREGVASPRGTFEAGATWEPGQRPLKLHVWDSTKECAYVQFGGTPRVSVGGGELAVAVNDATIEESKGSAKVRAALWFRRLGHQTFAVSESTAANVRFELFGAQMRATATSASLTNDILTLGLTLIEERPAARQSR